MVGFEQPSERSLSRRNFLKMSGVAGATLAVGGGIQLPDSIIKSLEPLGIPPQQLPTNLAELFDLLEQAIPFSGVPSFMRKPRTREVNGADLVVMGVPFDSGTFNRSGTRYGPRVVREQSLYASAFQPVYPWEYDLSEKFNIIDYGDVTPLPGTGVVEFMLQLTELAATEIFNAGARLLSLGGDHTLPYGMVRAAAKKFGKLALIHLDSHQDSADGDEVAAITGTSFINHGTFATGLIKEGHIDPSKSSQVYIRTIMPSSPQGGYQIIYANEALQMPPEQLAEMVKTRVGNLPTYLTFDIDAVDAAYAPGTGSPVPGGPTTADVRRFLRALEGVNIVAADLVEVNPLYDPSGATAIAGAYFAIDLLYLLAAARQKHSS